MQQSTPASAGVRFCIPLGKEFSEQVRDDINGLSNILSIKNEGSLFKGNLRRNYFSGPISGSRTTET